MKMKRECRMCGTEFEAQQFRGTFPAYCPTCQDIRQKRPSIIIERELLFGPVIVEIESLPGKWEEFRARERDLPCCKISVKGRRFGASWRGRIDTLKGLGRQYRYKHVGCPIWSASIHGSVRSGRKGAEGVLAIVDDEHPLSVECVFDR